MIKAIVGTAGHVDHGKTALLKALTGIDCDRLPEEKIREITIDLGFAYMESENVQIGFIDVPGHERFLKNLLSGISGFQFFLFCIAADEGIKAQTIEHMQILKTLGLNKGIIALTKIDLVDYETIEKRKLEIFHLFEKEGFEKVKIIPVSSIKGTNVDLLKKDLINMILEDPPIANLNPPIIYPIDRVFILSGKGLIVTGTLLRGEIKLNDELFLNPGIKKIRVKSIEVHKEKREKAMAVERVALQITGVEKEDLRRGLILSNIELPKTKLITIKINLIKEVKENTRLRIAHHTEEVYGRFHKIDEKIAQIFLETPINALKGDKVVLRRFAPPEFFGSGEILDIYLERVKKDEEINLGKSLKEYIEFWIRRSGLEGTRKDFLWQRTGFIEKNSFENILKDLNLIEIKGILWSEKNYKKLKEKTLEKVENFKKENPNYFSLPLRAAFDFLKEIYVEEIFLKIAKDFGLKIEKGMIILKEKEELSKDLNKILEAFKGYGLMPPDLEILSKELKIPLDLLKRNIKDLLQRGFLVQVSVGFYVEKNALDRAIEKLKKTGWEKFTIAEFKELFGLTRKWAVPLLEYFDSIRLTIRSKEFRILKK